MQYAPLINASTKLGYIHRFLSQPITWLPTQSVKILLFLPKDFESQSSSITYPYISESYYRKIVYSEKSPIFNNRKIKNPRNEDRNRFETIQSSLESSKSRVSPSLSLLGNRIPRLHNEVWQCGHSFSVNQSSQPSRKTRLLSANWYRALTQFRSGVRGPCRGGLSRVRVPPRGVLSLSLWHALLSTRALARKLNEALFDIYIYIYTFCKVAGHGSWRILRSAGVISLKDSRRFTDRCFLQKSRRLRV